MAIPDTDRDTINRLTGVHEVERARLKLLNDEYELRSARAYMHPEIMRELGDRLQQVVIAWPQLVVDSLEERLDVEGFRLPGEAAGDDELWRVWQENGADEQSQLAHVDALVMKRAYIAVGTSEVATDTPLMTFESPLELYAEIDPRTRRTLRAIKRWGEPQESAVMQARYVTLYEPGRTVHYDVTGDWKVIDEDPHGLTDETGELIVPIVPMLNRGRLASWMGCSELSPILPLAHAANKLATDMMVAAEFVAIPLRGIFGIGPQDLEDPDGNKLSALQAIMGRLLMLPDDEGNSRQFEFTSANLANFHESINQLARMVASLAGLPPHFLGLATDNPPSADAIRSSEARLVKRAERKQRAFGGPYEQAMRLVRRFQEGDWDPALRRLETIWRDASTPTVAQAADAAVKLYSAGIVPLRQTRQDLGYTDGQIELMETADDQAASLLKLPTAAEQVQPQPSPAVPGAVG